MRSKLKLGNGSPRRKRNAIFLSQKQLPGTVSSSGSSSSGMDDENNHTTTRQAGVVSPQTTCSQRKLSIPIVTSPHIAHDLLEGRQKIVLPFSSSSRTSRKPNHYHEFLSHPPPMRSSAWMEGSATDFSVRGATYLYNSLKVPSQPSLFRLLTVDVVSCRAPNFRGLCAHPHERIQRALAREKETQTRMLPEFIFAVNLCFPKPNDSGCFHWVAYFGIDDKSLLTTDQTPTGRLARKFFFGSSDTFRNNTFKLIPRVSEGNFMVRKAVGTKPSLLGTKLQQYYIRTDRFMEIVVDIGSDAVAQRIVQFALGYAKNLTVDMMFLLEGKTVDTLPERILGGVRVKNVDFSHKDGQRVCPPM